MAKHTLTDTDESLDGLTIFFYSKSGQTFEAERSEIVAWIEETELNQETGGFGLVSDPHSRDEVITIDAEEYYQENYNDVNESYFKQVINK